jgi:tRNA nucleotidyltransferase/poly(A) polymerase
LVSLSKAIDEMFIQRDLFIAKHPNLAPLIVNDYKPYAFKSTGESEFVYFGYSIDLDILRSQYDYFTKTFTPTNNVSEDTQSRDFTVNCLYYDISSGKIIDPVGGLQDLKYNTLRFIEHKNNFLTYPFTIFRQIKMQVKYKMQVAKEVKDLLKDSQFQQTYVYRS